MEPTCSSACLMGLRLGLVSLCKWLLLLTGIALSTQSFAHGVAEGDAVFIEGVSGMQLLPFVYLGAKHMVTGYDHLLFLFGVRAPSEAWCVLQGASPCRVRFNQPPVSSVAPVAERL